MPTSRSHFRSCLCVVTTIFKSSWITHQVFLQKLYSISCTSMRPWVIKEGDILGYLTNPETFDNPSDELEDVYASAVDMIKLQIKGTLKAQDMVQGIPCDIDLEEASPKDEEEYSDEPTGPKTSALAEDPDTVIPDEDLDLSSLTEARRGVEKKQARIRSGWKTG
ncbi:hypothetical protein C8R42DRAFT_639432 [Lentinula raphanica]|nr:hypothetical protein C8R42DRAFT_639432 [Lentinula raphanica]